MCTVVSAAAETAVAAAAAVVVEAVAVTGGAISPAALAVPRTRRARSTRHDPSPGRY